MEAVTQIALGEHELRSTHLDAGTPRWSLVVRIAFRFCFAYFAMYCVLTQISTSLAPLPNVDIPDPGSLWGIRAVVPWVSTHILRLAQPAAFVESGSGDKAFDWVFAFTMLVTAVLATGVWSLLDRRRPNYTTLDKWFRVCIRFGLAGQMISYGWNKAIPTQMPFPFLTTLLEPYGNFSPMGVLWSSIGASQPYEIFAGCAELLAGILLIFPRTAMLGALVCLADVTEIFTLNMTYDVPVKLLSFHLILLAVFLLAPEGRRLADFFVRDRAVERSGRPELFVTRRANRIALAAQIGLGVWLVVMNAWSVGSLWKQYGGGRPRPALYGIWNVEEFSVDGQVRAPLLTDNERWRRLVFDFPTEMSVQHMDGSFTGLGAEIDDKSKTIALTKRSDKNWKASFAFDRPAQEQLVMDGAMDGHKMHIRLQMTDRSKFLLVSRGFHWVQEQPFNR